MTGTGDSIPQAPKGPYPGCAGFSGEIPQPPARMISPETARGMTLHSRWGYGLPLPVEWILRFPVSVLILLTHYALASPADVGFSLAVTFPYQQAVDDGHRDIELLEDFRLLLHLAGLDELVEPFLCQYQCHQVLFHGILVGHEMDVLQFLGVQADEAEVELLHLGDVPLQGFKDDIVAGGDIYRAAQALLRAYQYAVDGGIEFRNDALPLLERDVTLDGKYRSVRETLADEIFVQFKRRYGGAADGNLAGNLPYQFLDEDCLVRVAVPEIALYQVGHGAGLDKKFDLAHETEPGILFRVARTVVVKLADTTELLDDNTVHLVFPLGWCDRVHPYLVFFSGKVLELARDDGLADKLGQFVLVIYVLVLLLDAEHGRLAGTVAGPEQYVPPEGGERFSVVRVWIFLYLPVPVLVVYPAAPANHVYGVIVQQFKLAVQLRDVVARGRSRVEDLVFEPAEDAQDMPCAL